MRLFTEEELSKYDGTGGNPTYVAYKGKVYDVSSGANWIDGSHYQHFAGEDLTEAMADAPHGDDSMDRFPAIGELAL
jgi:predicted heme/steroid binding protein